MTYTELTTNPDYIRLHKAVISTMTSIAISNASKLCFFEKTDQEVADSIEDDVDASFGAIDNFMEAFELPFDCGFTDTVTRRCAKSEIHTLVRDCVAKRKLDNKFDLFKYIEQNITGQEVFEDFIHMNTDDDNGVNHLFTELAEVS
jgi:hypothetical protein